MFFMYCSIALVEWTKTDGGDRVRVSAVCKKAKNDRFRAIRAT